MSGDGIKLMEWKVGLQNPAEKFLTAEPVGHRVNAAGIGLKQRQTWTLEMSADDTVYLKSYLGYYLSADKFGNVTCDKKNATETEKFKLEYAKDGSGRWSFRHAQFEYFLGGNGETVQCLARAASDTEMSIWHAPVAMHPQITLYNVNRKRYVVMENGALHCNSDAPWGPNALITLEFFCGKYRFKTADNHYLSNDGTLLESHGKDTQFTLELKFGRESDLRGIAFKDINGKYLTAIGASALVKTRNKSVSKDELFRMDECHPQIVIQSQKGKFASIRNGLEVMVNAIEETNKEIFQVEYDKKSKKWGIFTVDNRFWNVNEANTIIADASKLSTECLFDFEWKGDGKAAIKASNRKYFTNKPIGNAVTSSDVVSEKEIYVIKLVNRPLIVFKCEYGFVAQKTSGSNKTEYICNKSMYDVILLEQEENGVYHLKGDNEKYWSVTDGHTIKANSSKPSPFILEFRGNSLLSILAPNGKYIRAEKSGGFRAVSDVVDKNSLWYF
ncbi:hypothetical protein FSP39_004590 [Pinctada imbricata]|uniref:Fascin n=1 Tax=Pinctada imbricata TaxID=66713 RepID=A0AA88YUU7_PINIB|nr:hypothetical protein FSP39_004590 [Pinctada imbricata]